VTLLAPVVPLTEVVSPTLVLVVAPALVAAVLEVDNEMATVLPPLPLPAARATAASTAPMITSATITVTTQ